MNPILSLTGLRCYAALMVFLAHTYHFNYFGIRGSGLTIISSLGHMGVSLFFVLSGFVLTINYPRGRFDFKSFYVARFARIYPVFLLGVLTAIPIEWYSRRDCFFSGFFVHAALGQGFLSIGSGRFNDVGWTLTVESLFYLLFPFLLVYVAYRSRSTIVWVCLLAVGLVLFNLSINFGGFVSSHRFPPNRIVEFLMGICIGVFYQKNTFSKRVIKHPRVSFGLVFALLGLVVALPAIMEDTSSSGRANFLVYGAIFSIVIILISELERKGFSLPILTHPAILTGGEISYSFYLFHNLVLRYFKGVAELGLSQDLAQWSLLAQLLSAFGLFVVTVLLSLLLFKYIEIPFRAKIRNALISRPKAGISTAAITPL